MLRWKIQDDELDLTQGPLLMGILNVTPNSFSDGGRFVESDGQGHVTRVELDALVRHAKKLIHEGADLLDLGGVSTAPGAPPVSEEEELNRILPVLPTLLETCNIPFSIDTTNARVADAACELGVAIVNDVSGGLFDPNMADVIRRRNAGVCLGHIQGTPSTMQDSPCYRDVVWEVHEALRARRDAFLAAGVAKEAICLDPGLGFGKSLRHNLSLIRHLDRFLDLDQPILVGHSRKRMLTQLATRWGGPCSQEEQTRLRDRISCRVAQVMVRNGANIIRVHDVALHESALVLERG